MVKKKLLWLHKWLGLISGLVVLIVSLTGCLNVFQDELQLMTHPEKFFIEKPNLQPSKTIALSELISIAEKNLNPGEKISRVDIFPQKNRTWVFRALKTNKEAFFYFDYFTYYKRVFVNPYTGNVQVVEDTKTNFFQIVLQLHMNLLLGKKYGHVLVGFSTIFFAILCLSGIVLWWPKKWKPKTIKDSFSINFKAKSKRLNYDLHNVLGFYSLLVALLFAFTGLVFAFPAFKKMVSNQLNALDSKEKQKLSLPFIPQRATTVLDNGLNYVLAQHSNADQLSIRIQKDISEPQDIQVRIEKNRTGVFYWYYFNPKNGQVEELKTSDDLQLGSRVTSLNYDLHVGSIGGIYTKILAFFGALVCASLPVTGFIIWLNKYKKSKLKRI
ncbi:PepSY-associated TM helix domain-containing protein [Flavobacterium yafengii]|uniref:PepSY-associated TM helix domain-containing protein n=1 Tax=Flavobacterium yafengii TaxID=3041253 RepID=UPI0024A836E0|nr:PepSY-associated TM helix domain-containing protein [Flavobacterium yafengii]MDI6045146.1 PepSY-associated TM helix domain-containing protein [Flavobacterium yafengii]